MTPKNNQPMNRMNKILLCGMLLCLLVAGGKGYGQEVGELIWKLDTGKKPKDNYEYPLGMVIDESKGIVVVATPQGVKCVNLFSGKNKWAVSGSDSRGHLIIPKESNILVRRSSNGRNRGIYGRNLDTGVNLYLFTSRGDGITIASDHLSSLIVTSDGGIEVGHIDKRLSKWSKNIKESRVLAVYPGKYVISYSPYTEKVEKLNIDTGRTYGNWVSKNHKLNSDSIPNAALDSEQNLYFYEVNSKLTVINKNKEIKQYSLNSRCNYGGPIIVDNYGKVYLTGKKWVGCLSTSNGEIDWQINILDNYGFEPVYHPSSNQKSSGGVLSKNGVYYFFGHSNTDGYLVAGLDAKSGLLVQKISIEAKPVTPLFLSKKMMIYGCDNGLFYSKHVGDSIDDTTWAMIDGGLRRCRTPSLKPKIVSLNSMPLSGYGAFQDDIISSSGSILKIRFTGIKPIEFKLKKTESDGLSHSTITVKEATTSLDEYTLSLNKYGYGKYYFTCKNQFGVSKTKYFNVKRSVNFSVDSIDNYEGNIYKDSARISIFSSFENSNTFYTIDGSEPGFESIPYNGSFTIRKTTVVRAVSYKNDFTDLIEGTSERVNILTSYKLNVNTQGQGSVNIDPLESAYLQDSVVNLKAVPNEGWRFRGWDGSLKSAFVEGVLVMSTRKSVRAIFEPIPKYRLETSTAGGGVILGNEKSPYYQGVELTITSRPNKDWVFINWSGDAVGPHRNVTIAMDRIKQVKAIFGTNLQTISTERGKLIIDPPNGPYPHGSKINITPVPDAGYYLGVWGGDALGMPKGPIMYEITKGNPEITALFVPLKENRFTITALPSAGGTVVSNPNSNAYVNGQEVTLTANSELGYSFVGWTGDIESSANPLITLADANKTVTAQFRRNIITPVTLTINAENGTVTRTPADELYEMGTSVKLLAQSNPGYTFTGWAGALGGAASRATLFLDGDKVVTANFKASYQLAIETRGPGSVLTTPSSTTFIDGDDVILTASPAEGYGFVGWSGDLESTDQQTSLAMDGNKRVIAHFAQLGTLTTWARGEGTITRSPDKESYFPGASVTLTATAGDGFQFVNWDGQASGNANPTTVTMDRAMSVAANFKDIKAPTVTITSPASQETGEETFNLSGSVSDNGSIKTLVWLWKGKEMGELELAEGKFSLEDQKLVGGPNDITVIATDRSGNEGKATATPTWAPNRSIRIAVATEQQEGNRIEVPIEINSKGDVGGMGFVLNYNHSYLMDPVLTWSSAAGGSINLVNEDVAGELRGTFSLGGTSLPAGEQLIGTVSFRARSVPENLETVIGLKDISVSDPVGAIFESGTDVVSGQARVLVRGITGDNNANDRLDVGDATRIQRLLVRMDVARAWDVAGNDLNGNGALDPGDVTKVLRAVVGIDPQPNRNRAIAKMGGDDDEVETVVLSIKEKTANTVTVQITLKDMQNTIAGANFQLEYPVELLRLKDRTSHSAGGMVVKNAAAIWNVSPAQTDYSKQDGTLAMAVSSPEPWTVKDGVLAELTFEVQDGADLNKAVLSLSEVEVTPDGFDNRMLDGVEINVGSGATTEPEPSIIEIVEVSGKLPFGFKFDSQNGKGYVVEATDDLSKWNLVERLTGTGLAVQFTDKREALFERQYYRVRVE
jgi:hypothetical protein